MFGLLNLHKPIGITSRDAVNVVARLVRPAKVGHAGTLDPLAEGVLVVGIGHATRLVEYVQQMEKQYRGEFLLGRSSSTEDIEGEVTELADPLIPTREQLEAAASKFIGEIKQRPPQYSALKISGRPAYELARRGETVELAARPITIHDITIVDCEYPRVVLDVRCGSGTYIRSLGRDIAESLGTAAVMSALVRTAIGPFTLANATKVDALTAGNINNSLLPPTLAVANMPQRILTLNEVVEINAGKTVEGHAKADTEIAAIDESGNLRAILIPRGDEKLGPNRVFK